MNNSRRTRVVAYGLYLWATLMDYPEGKAPAEIMSQWVDWSMANPTLVEFVKAEQFALFDRVNARF